MIQRTSSIIIDRWCFFMFQDQIIIKDYHLIRILA